MIPMRLPSPARLFAPLAVALALGACDRAPAPAPASDTAANEATAPAPGTSAAPPANDIVPAPAADTSADASPAVDGAWRYAERTVDGGTERSATASGSDGAQLVFRDDPVWGRSAYVELAQGDVVCPTGCKAEVRVDGGAATTVQASRPETPQPRLSLREPEALWRSLAGARTVSIAIPSQDGASTDAVFDVAGADAARLPGWK